MSISIHEILDDFSLEMTGKDIEDLHDAGRYLSPSTRVNVTFLGNENLGMRASASRAVSDLGFVPVPHIAARRIDGEATLETFLSALQGDGTATHIFAIAGDPSSPEGPFADALSLIQWAPLTRFDVRTVSISGYPDGHPNIPDEALWSALIAKASSLSAQGMEGSIVTQFGFDVDHVIDWIERVRQLGIDLPIRVGVPGPAGVKRLLSFARRFGVSSSAGIAKKYGLSLTNLLATAGPDQFIRDLAERVNPSLHGSVKLHFYTFGGLTATAKWIRNFDDRTKDYVA
jgi:methylenetetrahydrofolate reductase (NADPH)